MHACSCAPALACSRSQIRLCTYGFPHCWLSRTLNPQLVGHLHCAVRLPAADADSAPTLSDTAVPVHALAGALLFPPLLKQKASIAASACPTGTRLRRRQERRQTNGPRPLLRVLPPKLLSASLCTFRRREGCRCGCELSARPGTRRRLGLGPPRSSCAQALRGPLLAAVVGVPRIHPRRQRQPREPSLPG